MGIDDILKKAEGNKPIAITYEDCVNWWISRLTFTNNDYNEILDNFRIIFTQSSNAIENIILPYHTTRDIYENKTIPTGCKATDVFAVRNQKLLFVQMIKDINDNIPITSDLIKSYHNILLAGCYDDERWSKGEKPGEYKIGDYGVGLTEVGSLPEDVSKDLDTLLDEFDSLELNTISDKLKAVAYFHLMFENIHPFADGNGRIGRAIMAYMLMSYGLPPTAIHSEDKETYYMALEVFDQSGQIDGFIQFIKEQTIKTWNSRVCR